MLLNERDFCKEFVKKPILRNNIRGSIQGEGKE